MSHSSLPHLGLYNLNFVWADSMVGIENPNTETRPVPPPITLISSSHTKDKISEATALVYDSFLTESEKHQPCAIRHLRSICPSQISSLPSSQSFNWATSWHLSSAFRAACLLSSHTSPPIGLQISCCAPVLFRTLLNIQFNPVSTV